MVATKKQKKGSARAKRKYIDDSLVIYLKKIGTIPILTRAEERLYAERAAQGDKAAKEKLVTSNLRFVVNIAKTFQNQGLPLEDLIAEGNTGLLNAVDRFDVNKGVHFISYAVWWIRQAIFKAINEKSRAIRLPVNRIHELNQIQKLQYNMENSKGSDNNVNTIAEYLHFQPSHVNSLLALSKEMVSLEESTFEENAATTPAISNSNPDNPEANFIRTSLKEDINKVLATLKEKEREVLIHRFGLEGSQSQSLKDIGKRQGLTKERIRQILKNTLTKLSETSSARHLYDYLS